MFKFIITCFSLTFIFSLSQQVYSQDVIDDFEGNGNITNWYGHVCSINTNLSNPHQSGINTSATNMEYNDAGGQYANVSFDISETYDLSSSAVFSLKIYVPSTGLTGNQTNQVSLKLQDATLPQPWVTQTEIVKPIVLDQWQTISFDFANDNYINLDPNSPPPIQRNDFNRVLIQINGENNYDHVLAYIDDVLYDTSNVMSLLQSNDRFEFWGLPSEQPGADVLFNILDSHYLRISDSLNTVLSNKISVYVYSSNDALHIGMGWPDAPDWVVGVATGSDRIDIVSPYKSSSHNFDQVSGIGIHEMVHCYVYELADFTYPPLWLNEGTASYLASETQPEFSQGFCGNIDQNNGSILTLDELDVPNTFGEIGGYGLSGNIVEFIINRLGGSEVLSEFIQSNGQDYSILGYSNKQEFQDEWNQYVFINYPCNYTGLHAVFDADQVSGDYPLTVQFNDYSIDDGNSITSWSWDFDNDGITDSNAQNPTWAFIQPGNYAVSLTVDNGLETNAYTKNIEVFNPQNNQQEVFNKDFEDQNLTSGGWTAVNSTGAQIWTIPSTTIGHNDSYCIKMNGYDNGAFDNEDWLISPSFSADTNNGLNLSFWNTSGYSGPDLELYWTNTYTGNPQTTNWNIINSAIWHDGNTDWLWTFSGIIDLSNLSGSSVHLGFKYSSSVQNGAAMWLLDDIKLTETIDYSIYFTDYNMFISKLNELTSSTDHAPELDQFWNQLIATGNFPFAINTEVAFLYRGDASSIQWAGDFSSGNPPDDGVKLGVSNIWLLEKVFPSDSRLSYKILKNGNEWLSDEHNPNPLGEEWGNSSLRMPDYEVPPETIFDSTVPTGNFTDNIIISSTHLGYDCQYRVYTPAGYDGLSNLPVIYVTDGQNFSNNTFGKMRIVLDNYINDGTIEPVIAVFLDPRDPYNLNNNRRANEYRNNIDFVNYVTQELVPEIDANYNTDPSPSARAIAGSSYGGYNAAYFLAKVSNQIQNNAILSPVIHPNPPDSTTYNAFLADLIAADLSNSKIYMSYGIFHDQEDYYFGELETILNQKGKVFESDIVHDGHNYFNWNGVIGDALEYFFPAQPLSVIDNKLEFDFKIYPNPATDRVFLSIKEKSLVTLYTINGIKVLEKEITLDGFIDVEGLNKGIYLVLVKNNTGMKAKKLIIK
jgi:enterochelin esterase family protein